jgi:hypothetical protein
MINRVSAQEMARRHQEHAAKRGGGGPPPRPRNIRPVLWLTDPFRIPFRGHMWEIPRVTVEDGARVLDLISWLDAAAADPEKAVAEYRDRMLGAVKLVRRLVRPHRGRLRKLLWRMHLLPNPWRSATHEELGEILGFFWLRRTMSPGRRAPQRGGNGKGPTS